MRGCESAVEFCERLDVVQYDGAEEKWEKRGLGVELLAHAGEGVVGRGGLDSAVPTQGFVWEGYSGESLSCERDMLVGVNVVIDAISYLSRKAKEGGCELRAWAEIDEFARAP